MTPPAVFGLSVLMSFVAFGIVTRLYIWPRLRSISREDALVALTVPHTFRFVGLSFLVPGVVSPSLPSAFAAPAAYGDLVAAILAIIAIGALSAHAVWAIAIVWLFNVWGTADLLNAIYQGQIGVTHRSRVVRGGVLHPNRHCPGAPRFAWAELLGAPAGKAIERPIAVETALLPSAVRS